MQKTAYLLRTGLVFCNPLYNLITSNKQVSDSAWRSFSAKERAEVNSRMGMNTFDFAVQRKDVNLASRWGQYVFNAWSKTDWRLGRINQDKAMIRYLRAVQDTVQLVNHLNFFVDRHFAKTGKDTLQKYRDLSKQLTAELKKPLGLSVKVASNSRIKLEAQKRYADFALSAPAELNNSAWDIYQHSNDGEFLYKALRWSKQSIELDPKPEFYDTLAHLLYKLEFFSEAERAQLDAVQLSKGKSSQVVKYKEALRKIRNREL